MADQIVVETHKDGAVEVWTLNRAEKLNALSTPLVTELAASVQRVRDDPRVRAVVITGRGRAFCAGADLAELDAAESPGEQAAFARRLQAVLGAIEALDRPVLAALNGLALGGGCELLLACDLVVADESATIGVPEIKVGVIPGSGGTQRLPRAVGRNVAKDLVMRGTSLSARRAYDLGLVNEVVAGGEALPTALAWASEFVGGPSVAVGAAKRVINRGIEADLAGGLELELQALHALFGTQDAKDGLRAFVANTRPEFRGR